MYPACTRVSQETLLVDGQYRYLLGIVSNREFDLSRSYALYDAALVEVVLSIMKRMLPMLIYDILPRRL